jgi:hypothetical protein
MYRLKIVPLAALVLIFLAVGANAQNTPSVAPKTPESRASHPGTNPHQPENAKHHRVVLLRVDEVIAADTDEGIDERLLPMGTRLESLFHFTTYRLVSRQVGRAECGRAAAFTLPGGWIVHVEPNGVSDGMIAMELMLFQGARPMMTTDLRLRNHGMLIVGGPHYRQGMLIIPIGAEVPELNDSGPLPVNPAASGSEGSGASTPDMLPGQPPAEP